MISAKWLPDPDPSPGPRLGRMLKRSWISMVPSVRAGRRGALLMGSPFAVKRIYTLSPSHVLRILALGKGNTQIFAGALRAPAWIY